MGIQFDERELTSSELALVSAGFAENAQKHGNPSETAERITFVALNGESFVGCSSGLAYKRARVYENGFFITDLYVAAELRGTGVGSALLRQLESKVRTLGIATIWTWTAGFEAPDFYQKHGYEVFCEMEDWYPSGHSRFGVRKRIAG